MDTKLYSKSYVMRIIDQLFEELKNKGIPFEYFIDEKGVGGRYSDDGTIKDGRNHKINISMENKEYQIDEDLLIKIIEGEIEDIEEQFNEKQIMGIISTIFHEYRHLEQTERYKYNPDFSNTSKAISIMNAIQCNGLGGYYHENYRNDPKELDATKYSIEEAIKFINNNFPEIDAEKGIIQDIQDYIKEDKENEYGYHMFDENKSSTVEEVLKQLQERIENPTRVSLETVLLNAYIEDEQLKKVFTDKFVKKYNNSSSAMEQDMLVLIEIVKLHPEILQEYPILLNDKELQMETNKSKKVDTRKLGKETLDLQKGDKKMDDVESELEKHRAERRPQQQQTKSFKDRMRTYVDSNNEAQEIINQVNRDLDNGIFGQENNKSQEDYNPEKIDDDYVL